MERIPFSEEELRVIGTFPRTCPQGFIINKFNTPITARENYMAFLRNETPLWMPNGDQITFCPSINPDNIARYGVTEDEPYPEKDGVDMFGISWVYVPEADGCMVRPGNPILLDANEWRNVIKFPDVKSWDWAGSAEANKDFLANRDAPVFMTHYNSFFERLISFMDFQNAAIAIIDEEQKEAVKELFDALCDLYIEIISLEKKYFDLTGILFHDDWGSQRAPFFSLVTFREMILPFMQKITSFCHSKDIIVELHSCGCSELLAEGIAETGIDMWRPQPMNNIDRLYDLYGDKFKLGVRQPIFDSNATDEEKVSAAKKLVAKYNTPGKYVYTMSHFQDPLFRMTLYRESRIAYNLH